MLVKINLSSCSGLMHTRVETENRFFNQCLMLRPDPGHHNNILNLHGLASSWRIPGVWWLVGHPTRQSEHQQFPGQDPCEGGNQPGRHQSQCFHQGGHCCPHSAKSFDGVSWIWGWGWWGKRRRWWPTARTSFSPSTPPSSLSTTPIVFSF